MQFLLPRDLLTACLHRVVGVLDRRQTLPILGHVLLHIQGDELAVTATDSEIELVAYAKLPDAQEAVDITLPGRKLYDICRVLPEGSMVEMKLSQQLMQIRCGRSRFSLQTLPAADFPSLEDLPAQVELSLQQGLFLSLLEQTHFAVAQQDVRYFLNGLLLDLQKEMLVAVGSDGHRLALAQLPLSAASAIRILLPRRGVLELIKLLGNDEASMNLALSPAHLQIKSADFHFTSRLIDGQFPDYRGFFPRQLDKVVTVANADLKQALSRAAILASDKVKAIRFELTENLLTLTTTNQEHEEAQESLTVDYAGPALSTGFNLSYFLDVLTVLKGEQLRIQLADADSSIVIESTLDNQASYLIMPLRI